MKTWKPYAGDFKQEAVKLVTEQVMTVRQVACDLDISFDTLHRSHPHQQPNLFSFGTKLSNFVWNAIS